MPDKESVVWLNSSKEIAQKIKTGLSNSNTTIDNAQKWFEKINQCPPQLASQRIWEGIKQIVK